jgi:predicted nucleotidyltransferase
MRLTNVERKIIREQVAAVDDQAEVFLFGSRADDQAKGGDIDILVLSQRFTLEDELRAKIRILDRIGWQKLDLLVVRDTSSPLASEVVAAGVRL